MFYNEKMPLVAAKPVLVEGRYKTTKHQKDELIRVENELKIPQSAIIRMALDCFLPKLLNNQFTEKGIKAGYLNKGY